MPKFTLDLSPAAVTRLNVIVGTYNANNGTALTLPDWLVLHLKEVATQDEMAVAVDALRKQAEADGNAAFGRALEAKRQQLMDSLGVL